MSSKKSALKKGNAKTKKRVTINIDKNEGFINDKPDPITPRSKSQRWADPRDYEINRHIARREKYDAAAKERAFLRARKNVPIMAAQIARGRFRTGSPPSPRPEGTIQLRRGTPVPRPMQQHSQRRGTWRDNVGERPKGPISSMVSSVFRFFGRGGRKTRKNRRK
jgi:hypothetical protein